MKIARETSTPALTFVFVAALRAPAAMGALLELGAAPALATIWFEDGQVLLIAAQRAVWPFKIPDAEIPWAKGRAVS